MKTSTIKINFTETLILSTLQAGEKNGLEIIKSFKNEKKSIEKLYPTLHNLVKKGFVKYRWVEDKSKQKFRSGKRYYSLTELGKKTITIPI